MKFITLTFDRDHTHTGRLIKRGEIRDIPQHNAEWLIAHNVAHPAPSIIRDRKPRRDTTEEQSHAE